jgi:hypothetical protein
MKQRTDHEGTSTIMHGGCGNLGGVMLWSCEGKDSFCVTKHGVIMKKFCTGSPEGIAFFSDTYQ